MRIAHFDAVLASVDVDGDRVPLWRVADLERHVDRAALLAADDPPEPPYWAHLWSGALVLAGAVPTGARSVIELGCGLGLPGIVAARRGARVVFLDRASAALAFVRASAAANQLGDVAFVAADATTPVLRRRFDLVLVAELLYDRALFVPLASALAGWIALGGRALLSDAGRVDTSAFYAALDAARLPWSVRETVVREEGLPVRVRLVEIVPPPGKFLADGGAGA
jgi:protein N-lysine methyltransferase METTL21A